MKTKNVSLKAISDWLRSQESTWWSVDGDHRLESELLMPAEAATLAAAITKYCQSDEQITVILPETPAGTTEVEQLFSKGGNGYDRALQAEGGDHDEGWLLVEQTQTVNEANQEIEEHFQSPID